MTTVLQYLVIAAVIGLLLFGLALLLFGRGERMKALPARTSPAQLPADSISGADVRKVRFALAVRGYRMSDVDWTLDKLADELDRAREKLAVVVGPDDPVDDAHADVLADQRYPANELPPRTEPADAAAVGAAAQHPDGDLITGNAAIPTDPHDLHPNPDRGPIRETDSDVLPAGTTVPPAADGLRPAASDPDSGPHTSRTEA